MAKIFHPRIVSANDLFEGHVVYLGRKGWTTRLDRARIAESPEAAETLLAEAEAQPDRVVGPYLVDVVIAGDGQALTPRPLRHREIMRVTGPGIHVDEIAHPKEAGDVPL